MNFDYFVERGVILNEMAAVSTAFIKYPEVQNAYNDLVKRVKESGDVNLTNANTQVRNRIYTQTQDRFLDQDIVDDIKNQVMEFPSPVRRQMWYRLFAPTLIKYMDSGKLNPDELIQFWNSLYNEDAKESEVSNGPEPDSEMLNYISSDDSEDVSKLPSNRRIGANRRMKELTSSHSHPMSYLQYTKLYSYMVPRLKKAYIESRKLAKAKNPESNESNDMDSPYSEDVNGWITDAAETLKEGIMGYKELYDSGEIELDEIVDESGQVDKLAQILVLWKTENFEKSLNDIVTAFISMKKSPSPDKFIEKMQNLSDQMADAGNKSASALFMAFGREFSELYNTEAPEEYTETSEQPFIGFDKRVLSKVFDTPESQELFKAWYDFKKSLQDYNMELLDFRRSNNFLDSKERLRAHVAGESPKQNNNSGLTNSIVQLRAVINSKQADGEDTSNEEKRLAKMEAQLGKDEVAEPKQAKNPWKAKIDDLEAKIQHHTEQLNGADPAYAKELKSAIARMNAQLEMAYQQSSEWQPPVQESVLSYMEEQVQRDSKFGKSKGQFVDRGFKKFKNYNHWLINN